MNSANANSKEVTGLKSVVAASKASGVCTAYGSMMEFQLKNDIKGGNDFIKAFMTTVIGRSGMTNEEFFASCKKANLFIEKIKNSPDY